MGRDILAVDILGRGESIRLAALVTTVACNRDMMSSDSLCDDGGMRSKGQKIFESADGSILGFAGSFAQGYRFVEWFEDEEGAPPECDEVTILILDRKGKMTLWDGGHPTPVLEKFYAIGSGSHAAMAAMMCGKTPREAVKIACKVDTGSGGTVKTIKRE